VPLSAEGDDAVLRLLASGMSVDAIAKQPSRDLLGILARAAALVRERDLLPPAQAALLETPGVETPPSELDALRSLSEQVLRAYLAGSGNSDYAALRYAEAIVRQELILDELSRIDPNSSPLQARLSGMDRKRVDDYLLYRNVKGRFETLDSLEERWERTVAWVVERGKTFTHDEYVDRLISRDSLATAVSLLSPGPRSTLDRRVTPLDRRFFESTRATSGSIRPRVPWRPQRWWWFRVPIVLGMQFQDRLRRQRSGA
jgi:hypothetical protein